MRQPATKPAFKEAKQWPAKASTLTAAIDRKAQYLYACEPHQRLGGVGVIQVGKLVHLAEALAVKEQAAFVMGKNALRYSICADEVAAWGSSPMSQVLAVTDVVAEDPMAGAMPGPNEAGSAKARVGPRPALWAAPWRLLLLMTVLWPILWLQSMYVRRITPRMPEPPGRRAGSAGRGPLVRLLVAGDSGAAGVGAPTQDQALCGQLVRCLSQHHTVHWCVLAANGLDSPGLLKLLEEAPSARFDVVVLSIGANDATGLLSPLRWARWQDRLAALIDHRFEPALLVHSAVPPMHACLALPQPLRWFMGCWAQQMNETLAGLLPVRGGRIVHWHPETTTKSGMAEDGIHPSSAGYAAWAEGLSPQILARVAALPSV